jgi:hypothetical protein
MSKMITKFRACFWALSFGVFFHISMGEHHAVITSILIGAFWTSVADTFVSATTRM